jgi:hypothetical protein
MRLSLSGGVQKPVKIKSRGDSIAAKKNFSFLIMIYDASASLRFYVRLKTIKNKRREKY